MKIEIIHKPLEFDLYGFSGKAINRDYAGTAFKLMDKMWQVVKKQVLKNKGINTWVYETNENVFAGVELNELPAYGTGLEHKPIVLSKYAYYKHVGPYSLIKEAGLKMSDKIKELGYETTVPCIELYGHWTNDESKLETELLMSLK